MHANLNPIYVFGVLLLAGPMVYMLHCASETIGHADGIFHQDGKCQVAAEAICWVITATLIFPLVFAFHNMEAEFVKPEAGWILYVNAFAYGVGFEGIVYLLRHPHPAASRRIVRKAANEPAK